MSDINLSDDSKMSGVVAFEGELNSIVKEYLDFNNFGSTLYSFEKECVEKGKPISPTDSTPKTNHKLMAVQKEMLQLVNLGKGKEFFRLWTEYLPDSIRNEDSVAQKIEFYMHIYFAIYPLKQDNSNTASVEEGMNNFKTYLETRGAALSQTTEFLPFYALPYVPKPRSHPSYKELFSDRWVPDLLSRLDKFLTLALQSTPQPRLFQLFKGDKGPDVQKLQHDLNESERKANNYMKRYNRMQGDYHNLIGITAELVDSLEATVHGKMVAPEYLQKICTRLFSNQLRQTVDFTRPGTAAEALRASVVPPHGLGDGEFGSQTVDYEKIKRDVASAVERQKGLLLQALRWKLTRAVSPDQRDNILNAYIINDILACTHPGPYREAVQDNLQSEYELVKEYTARLFNTVASLSEGRSYLTNNADLVGTLMRSLKSEEKETLTRENVLGCLQKLSLRRNLQSIMIEQGVIYWLVGVLEDNDSLSDYTLEYSVALLMNLCLRTAGKKKCAENAHKVLKVLSDLLGHENQEIIPYVNGALYSILAIPSIREEAKAMGMEEILRCFVKDGQPDMNRQIQFIIKQLNSSEEPEEGESDDEEEEEEEEDQEAMEADLDKQELLKAQPGELSGDQLLTAHYMIRHSPNGKKKKPTDRIQDEEVLMRPVTPGHMRDNQAGHMTNKSRTRLSKTPRKRKLSNPYGHLCRPLTSGGRQVSRPGSRVHTQSPSMSRPHTRSGSRPNTGQDTQREPPPVPIDPYGSEMVTKATGSDRKLAKISDSQNAKPSQKAIDKTQSGTGMDEYAAAFGTRARIPRTPDPGALRPTSRGAVGEGPPPQPKYSNSLPTSRPNSGGLPSSSSGKRPTSGGGQRPSTGGRPVSKGKAK